MQPNLAIGYIHPGDVSAAFTMSLVKLMVYESARSGVPPFVIANRVASGRIVEGRNEVAQQFLDHTKAEWLLVVDSDMGFAMDTAERLIGSAHKKDRPIVGALCFGMRRERGNDETHAEKFRTFPTVYVWRETPDTHGFQVIPDYPRDQMVLVSATGAACVLIHRSVLERVRDKYGDEWFSEIKTDKAKFSEDMSFFIRAQACDVPVHVHTGVKTCHDKGGVFLDEETFDRQQALDAPKKPELRLPEPAAV